jgi:3,4-dihydroxy 2-butanone 4-phosphate synthase/GTP cyclohydrolase II
VLLVEGHRNPEESRAPEFLVLAADRATPQALNGLSHLARGLVYACLTSERCDALALRRSPVDDESRWQSRLLESVDAIGCTDSGISAHDRALTIAVAVDERSRPSDLRRPGHVMVLRANPGGTLQRAGYTEAAVDLARLAGCRPAAVISEVLDEEGSIAEGDALRDLADAHGIPIVSVAEIARHRVLAERLVHMSAEAALPTRYGDFRALALSSALGEAPYLALIADSTGDAPPLVSVHRSCLAAAFSSSGCDCEARLDAAMRRIADEGGILIHLPRPTAHDIRPQREADAASAVSDAELSALILAELGVTRIRALDAEPLGDGGALGLDVVDIVTLEEVS